MGELELPPLDEDCPDCTGPAADADRAANAAAWRAWNADEQQAFEVFTAARREAGHVNPWDPDVWQRTDEYRALRDRQPEQVPERGCIECDYTGRRPTAAGRQILDFLAVHGPKS